MTNELLANVPEDIRTRAAQVRLAAFDVDGTLTDGRIWYDEDGRELKAFHAHDGYGLKCLLSAGIEVALITARVSRPVTLRANELGIQHVYQGQSEKGRCLAELQQSLGLRQEQTAFIGDDLSDIPAMQTAGMAVAVANAHPLVLPYAQWQTSRCGGDGAVREVCDMLLASQDKLAPGVESTV